MILLIIFFLYVKPVVVVVVLFLLFAKTRTWLAAVSQPAPPILQKDPNGGPLLSKISREKILFL